MGVNSGIARERLGMEAEELIHSRMKARVHRILASAHMHGVRNLVLGEYGCGALENNPRHVVEYFKNALLLPDSPFAGAFDRVVFSIHDEIGSQSCGRQRIPCLPYFVEHICPVGKVLYCRKGVETGPVGDLPAQTPRYRAQATTQATAQVPAQESSATSGAAVTTTAPTSPTPTPTPSPTPTSGYVYHAPF